MHRFRLLVAALFLVLSILPALRLGVSPRRTSAQDATPSAEASTAGWTTWRGNAGRTGVADAGPTGQPVQRWRVQAGGSCGFAPVTANGVVLATCDDGVLYALDAQTGAERWRSTGTASLAGLSIDGGTVFGADGDSLKALDLLSGKERWHAAVPGVGTAVAADGVLVVGTGDGFLIGLDEATAHERWRYQVTTAGGVHNPALADGVVYAGSDDPRFVAVDAATGSLRWHVELTGETGAGTAVVAEGIAYIGTGSGDSGPGRLFAFDAKTGTLRWRRDERLFSPAVLNGVGYSGGPGDVDAFDTATGTEKWRTHLGGVIRHTAIADGVVYTLSDGPDAVYALDAATGAQLWSFPVDGGIDSGVAVWGGVLYVTTVFGNIYAIGGTDQGAVPVASPVPAAVATAGSGPAQFLWQVTGLSTFYVAVAPDGTVWTNGAGKGGFQIFDANGAHLESWTPGGDPAVPPDSALFVAFGPDGAIYVTEGVYVRKYNRGRKFIASWGGPGSGDGQFQNATGLGVDATGNVYVCDELRNDVQKFDADGHFLAKWGGPGSGDGQFDHAGFMDVDPQGNSYVADHGNHRVEKFSPDGTFLLAFGGKDADHGQLSDPNDVAIDAAGNVFVGNYGSGRVQVFAPDGSFLAGWGTFGPGEGQLTSADGVALDGQGNVYVADSGPARLVKFRLLPPLAPAPTDEATPAPGASPAADAGPAEFVWQVSGGSQPFSQPTNLAIAPDGHHVLVLDATGRVLATWGSPGTGDGQFLDLMTGLAAAGDGTVYVADFGNDRVVSFRFGPFGLGA
jgi:outer membrane protein assembly factor BamB